MRILGHLIITSTLVLLCSDSIAQVSGSTTIRSYSEKYLQAIMIEANYICYQSKGMDKDMLTAMVAILSDKFQLTLSDYESIRKSDRYKREREKEIISYWSHMGSCDEMWRHYQSFERYYDQKKPQLKGDDPSTPFEF
jgi:hypothetical protein